MTDEWVSDNYIDEVIDMTIATLSDLDCLELEWDE